MHLRNPLRRTLPDPLRAPDMVPVLSPGKHRHPGKGACFMEMASYLAGERWSDHPHCTDPTLATLAREMNDHLDAVHREQLVPMIPDVIGTATEDPHVPLLVARAAALAVLDRESPHEGIAVLGLVHSEVALNNLDGRDPAALTPEARAALDGHDQASRWAQKFTREVGRHRHAGSGTRADRRAAQATVRTAVASLSMAPAGQERLIALLGEAIGICREAASRVTVTSGAGTRVA